MLTRMREAGLFWPTLATIGAFGLLVVLGFWQWQRMHWKLGLIERLEATASAGPVPLRTALTEQPADMAYPGALRFRRVLVTGVFLNDHELHVWAPEPRRPAWQVITPMRLAEPLPVPGTAAPLTHALVVRGAVPEALKAPRARSEGQPAGPVALTARIRLDEPNPSAPEPDPLRNQWFTRDLDRMVAHLKAAEAMTGTFAPFFLEAVERVGGDKAPEPRLESLSLTNRHFEYALTWWGLAATLLVVYATFAASRLKPSH